MSLLKFYGRYIYSKYSTHFQNQNSYCKAFSLNLKISRHSNNSNIIIDTHCHTIATNSYSNENNNNNNDNINKIDNNNHDDKKKKNK